MRSKGWLATLTSTSGIAARPWHPALGALAAGLALAPAPTEARLTAAAGAALVAAVLRLPAPLTLIGPALLLAGAAAGEARLEAIDSPGKHLHDGIYIEAKAHLLAHPRPGPFGSSAELELLGGEAAGAKVLGRSRGGRWPPGADPGMEVRIAGRFTEPKPPRDGGFDFAAHLRRRGVAGEVELDVVRATGQRRGGLAGTVDAMRRRAERAIAAGLPEREEALVLGMVLGQDERIPANERDDWRAAGLAHLLAVSGQNVMLLSALALPGLALMGLGRSGRAVGLLALIAVYVPLAGAGPSLQRAGVMGAAGIVALTASRPADRWYALLLAAAATLLANPRISGDAGWQLSFAAVAGILCLGPALRSALPLGPRVLAEGVAVTVAATVATAPLLGHHFGSVPLVGLPANLLALPAVAPVMWLGMVAAALGQLGEAAGPLASLAGELARVPAAYLAWLAERAAEAPLRGLRLPLGSPPWVAASYVLMGSVTLVLQRLGRRAEPRVTESAAWWRRLPQRRKAAAAAGVVLLLALVAQRAYRTPPFPGRLTVSFLDVGQGDATLIQHPDGTAVLFDGGPPEARVARLLKRAGVRRLALVVATHQSRDHQGGLREVLERFPVGLLLDGGDGTRDPGFLAVLAEARHRRVRIVKAVAPLALRAGGLAIRVLSPRPLAPGEPRPDDPNPRATVAVVSSGGFDLLLSGDAESEALLALDLPDVDAMKVPHHGSSDPGLPDVLERLRPEVAGIEVGEGNSYGHPAPSTLAALRRAGVRTWRTDRDGTVRVSVGGKGMAVTSGP